ncbi:hypothetical protein Bbelb_399810 [Branchiostoma belcheri]|nr:hypothetical protein Bbelb_399810 [Branchiostoma belcheri]
MSGGRRQRSRTADTNDAMNMQESQTDWTHIADKAATTPNPLYVSKAGVRSGDDADKTKCCNIRKKLWITIDIVFGVAIVLKGYLGPLENRWEWIVRLGYLGLLDLLKEMVLWEWMVRLGYLGLLGLLKEMVQWEWVVRLVYLGLLGLMKEMVLWEWMVRLGYLGLLGLLKEMVLWEWMVRLGYLGLLGLMKEMVLWEWMVRLGYLGLLGLLKEMVLWEWMVRLGYLGLLGLLKEMVLWEWMVRLGYLGLLGLLKEMVLWEWMVRLGDGPVGMDGQTGLPGSTGSHEGDGPVGMDGQTGLPGSTGSHEGDGPVGMDGQTGLPGSTGSPEANGPVGMDGQAGIPGSTEGNGPVGMDDQAGFTGSTGSKGHVALSCGIQWVMTAMGDGAGITWSTGSREEKGHVGMGGQAGLPGSNGSLEENGPVGMDGQDGVTGTLKQRDGNNGMAGAAAVAASGPQEPNDPERSLSRIDQLPPNEELPSWSASSKFDHLSHHSSSADRADINTRETADAAGAWIAATNDQDQWLMRDLGDVSVITGVITKGRNYSPDWPWGIHDQYVTSYTISYGNENGDETFYTDAEGQVTVRIIPPFMASGGVVVDHSTVNRVTRVRSRVVPGICLDMRLTLCPWETTFLMITPPRCEWVPNFGWGKPYRGHLVAPNGSRTDPCGSSTKTMNKYVFPANDDRDTEVYNDFGDFSGRITARFVKIHPQTWHGHISMRAKIVTG